MKNYELDQDEVLLYEDNILYIKNATSEDILVALTSKKNILQQAVSKGLLKIKHEIIPIDIIPIDSIKKFNDKIQIEQRKQNVTIQAVKDIYSFEFRNRVEAMKFTTKLMDAITNTTLVKRGVKKINDAFETVDDVLGFNARGTLKNVIENGIVASAIKGTGKINIIKKNNKK